MSSINFPFWSSVFILRFFPLVLPINNSYLLPFGYEWKQSTKGEKEGKNTEGRLYSLPCLLVWWFNRILVLRTSVWIVSISFILWFKFVIPFNFHHFMPVLLWSYRISHDISNLILLSNWGFACMSCNSFVDLVFIYVHNHIHFGSFITCIIILLEP